MSTSTLRGTAEKKIDDASTTAHDTVEALEDRAREGIEAGRKTATEAITAIEDLGAQAELTLEDASRRVTGYVQEKPLQAAGIAFAAGVLATLFLRRR